MLELADEKPENDGGLCRGLARLSAKGTGCGGTGAEAAAIFLHESDIDRGATKRMACQNK